MEEALKATEAEWEDMKKRADKARKVGEKAEGRHAKGQGIEKTEGEEREANVNLQAHKIMMEDLLMREEQERERKAAKKRARAKMKAAKKKKGGARKRRGDPAGWHSRIDPATKRKYYINDKTKEVSWEKPADVPGGDKYESKDAGKKKKEWHGWKKYKDPKSGRPYWHNKESNKVRHTSFRFRAICNYNI